MNVDKAVVAERLRQEQETFDHNKGHDAHWFKLRLRLGYAAMGLLLLIAVFCGWIVLHPKGYPPAAYTVAASALFVDLLGLLGSVWRIVLSPASSAGLQPVTRAPIDTDRT